MLGRAAEDDQSVMVARSTSFAPPMTVSLPSSVVPKSKVSYRALPTTFTSPPEKVA